MATENNSLTTLLKGKTISGTSDSSGKKTVTFDDGSVLLLTVETGGTNSASTGGSVESVDLDNENTTLRLNLSGGTSMEFALAGKSGTVELRDKDHTVIYTD